jgi:hypothetical protein
VSEKVAETTASRTPNKNKKKANEKYKRKLR